MREKIRNTAHGSMSHGRCDLFMWYLLLRVCVSLHPHLECGEDPEDLLAINVPPHPLLLADHPSIIYLSIYPLIHHL